jgi:chromosome segregation ATPase
LQKFGKGSKMAMKDIWSGTGRWLRDHKPFGVAGHQPQINDEGLISQDEGSEQQAVEETKPSEVQSNEVVVRSVPAVEKHEPLEKFQEGVNKLVEQLQGINEHLSRQVVQHEDLMGRIEQLPQLLENFPVIVENQKQMTEQLLDQLKAAAAKNEQFIDSVSKIPTETAKQTDALVNIDHQLAAAADTDVQMAESFNRFNQTLDKLNDISDNQTDSIMQMSKTFAASDRYLKYIISRQNKRFVWVYITSISICVAVVLILVGIIIYLRRY